MWLSGAVWGIGDVHVTGWEERDERRQGDRNFGTSPEGFDGAVKAGIAKASETVRDIRGAWVKEQMVRVEEGAVVEFRVDLKVTFVLE